MVFKMKAKYNEDFEAANITALPPQTAHLIKFASELSAGDEEGAEDTYKSAWEAGASFRDITRAACLAACTSGVKVKRSYERIVTMHGHRRNADVFSVCSSDTLEPATHHLVSLAACLVSNCMCASGHLVKLKELKVDQDMVLPTAAIAASVGGEAVRYRFFEHARNAEKCKVGCVC